MDQKDGLAVAGCFVFQTFCFLHLVFPLMTFAPPPANGRFGESPRPFSSFRFREVNRNLAIWAAKEPIEHNPRSRNLRSSLVVPVLQ